MLSILWDASHIWGYLLLNAVKSTGLPFRVVKADTIAQSGVTGKMLVVPGGFARQKAEALGPRGKNAILGFVEGGGHYLGFCGGAGLALAGGLGLCPWNRADMADRLQHLVSGHLYCSVAANHPHVPDFLSGKTAYLPVWWPGRFGEEALADGMAVLARYNKEGKDLYVADMPYNSMPADILEEWKHLYGTTLRPSILDSAPCMVSGTRGKGTWLLSYSHLETPSDGSPESQDAGRWFMYLIKQFCGVRTEREYVPPFLPDALPVLWDDPELIRSRKELNDLAGLAVSLGLLFPRNTWLWGWKSGVPGSQFNSLRLALSMTLNMEPDNARLAAWKKNKEEFLRNFGIFRNGARSWLLARRLADTLTDSAPEILPRAILKEQRRDLFGSPMYGGGLAESLLNILESLVVG